MSCPLRSTTGRLLKKFLVKPSHTITSTIWWSSQLTLTVFATCTTLTRLIVSALKTSLSSLSNTLCTPARLNHKNRLPQLKNVSSLYATSPRSFDFIKSKCSPLLVLKLSFFSNYLLFSYYFFCFIKV